MGGRSKGCDYQEAKKAKDRPENVAESEKYFNATTFEAALRSKGVLADSVPKVQWEMGAGSEKWVAYEAGVSKTIEVARRSGQASVVVRLPPHGWMFEIDFSCSCQRNTKTGKERAIRCAKGTCGP